MTDTEKTEKTEKKKKRNTYHTGKGHAIRLSLGVHALTPIVHSHAVALGLVARGSVTTVHTRDSAMTIGPLARQGAGRSALRTVLGVAALMLLVRLVLVLLLVVVVVVDRGNGAVIPEGHCVKGHVELVGRHN